jgi:hypothetical protein
MHFCLVKSSIITLREGRDKAMLPVSPREDKPIWIPSSKPSAESKKI